MGDFEVEVIDFSDVAAEERVIEFRYLPAGTAFVAVVVPDGGDWSRAMVSVDPEAGDVAAVLMSSLLEVARSMVEGR
ncbi:hypothetical protein [Streptomyces sp. NPDC089919]|uniref:hypothetical protein n=1 Tax=Streptomyces sp. NPDC089919 TaxID=3155188 RepID=UPI00344354F0